MWWLTVNDVVGIQKNDGDDKARFVWSSLEGTKKRKHDGIQSIQSGSRTRAKSITEVWGIGDL